MITIACLGDVHVPDARYLHRSDLQSIMVMVLYRYISWQFWKMNHPRTFHSQSTCSWELYDVPRLSV